MDTNIKATCAVCGEEKPLTGQFWNLSSSGGFRRRCKACRYEQSKAWRRENRKRAAALSKKWRESHPDYMPDYNRANRATLTAKETTRRKDPEYYARHLEAARDYRRRNRERINENRARSRLVAGLITGAEYDRLLKQQHGGCAICGNGTAAKLADGHTRRRTLCVDHDHTTRLVRGLLCHHCNTGLGWFRDRPELLSKAAHYLRRK